MSTILKHKLNPKKERKTIVIDIYISFTKWRDSYPNKDKGGNFWKSLQPHDSTCYSRKFINTTTSPLSKYYHFHDFWRERYISQWHTHSYHFQLNRTTDEHDVRVEGLHMAGSKKLCSLMNKHILWYKGCLYNFHYENINWKEKKSYTKMILKD
jgi:hypothetical protein